MTSGLLQRYSECEMPTRFGQFRAITYRDRLTGTEHIALVRGVLAGSLGAAVRVHSECLTGEAFGSLRCDCGDQLQTALEIIDRNGFGCLIYLRGQEGRGIGLARKIAAYHLQDRGLDTFDANVALGLPADGRDYDAAVEILKDLDIRSITLLTNNPSKAEALSNAGIDIVARQSLFIASNDVNAAYLKTKCDRFGHSYVDGKFR
ncbi:GTP cyclohydrolase II [Rhizobium lusitanum]|uniref:GTP cyclohydrolase II n=1 Tax=Rhizobium lusitanum TaxID=293958 RepID=UPI00157410F1|nr:GTP cyclohydrolase II [Rhizobium lusitanum]NTJ11791.1 GTP cyclohydrolase II [Rhizobium lusitanum]